MTSSYHYYDIMYNYQLLEHFRFDIYSLNHMVIIVATLSVSSLAYLMLDRLKYLTTVLTTVSTNPLVSDSSLPLITNSTSESFLYRNTSTQMHTIEYANSVPIDIMSISCSRLKIDDIIPDEDQSHKVDIAHTVKSRSDGNFLYVLFTREHARQQCGQNRCLILWVNVGEHAKQETVAGHGIQNPRQRKHGPDETVKYT